MPLPAASTPDLDRLAAVRRTPLKDEPAALVELLGAGESAVVRKVYRNRGVRLLQTFLRRSRAAREFANLAAVAAKGLPCTPPLACSERRAAGLVFESTLVTRYLPDTRSLKAVFAALRQPDEAPARRRLLVEFGALLARLHDAGILWGAALPRNALLQGAVADGRLLLCDLPAALRYRGPVPPRARLLDLFDALFSPSRRREFSRAERLRCLCAYAGGRAGARRLWPRLARRSPFGHRVRKNLVMAVRTYILGFLRPLPAPRPAPADER